jgi:redox-sensitive bicupin YhaK (pirin superfamily)
MGVDIQLNGHAKDLGEGFMVRRLLPSAQRQSVGPFLFFDHFGPVTIPPGGGHAVRPHPHIGLATVTYLFEGAMMHRDSLGVVQQIEPGAINWMTAGRGIVHSERPPPALAESTYVNHGLQLWAALPQAFEEVEPSFNHTAAADIPELTLGDADIRVLVGQAWGQRSPVPTFASTLYLDIRLSAGGTFELPPLEQELALYCVDAELEVDGTVLPSHTLALLAPGVTTTIRSTAAARLVVLGGDALDGHRFISWNFVSSRKERILQAQDDWEAQRMGQVPGETEFIPLPPRHP